jgi:hypothetical protein
VGARDGAAHQDGRQRRAAGLARWGLNYVIDEYLPRKLKATSQFLP